MTVQHDDEDFFDDVGEASPAPIASTSTSLASPAEEPAAPALPPAPSGGGTIVAMFPAKKKWEKPKPEVENPPAIEGRVPAHDLDTEAAILSAVMLRPDGINDVGELKPEEFYSEAHRQIFGAIRDLQSVGQPVDVVQVASRLKDKQRLAQVGGMPYLGQILDSAPVVAGPHLEAYVKRVRVLAQVRQLALRCGQICARTYGEIDDHEKFMEDCAEELRGVFGSRKKTKGLQKLGPIMRATYAKIVENSQKGEGSVGLQTGLQAIDHATGGLFAGDVTVIGARPGMGKAQPIDEPVLTPTGWRPIGDLVPGDLVIGSSGVPIRVLGVYPQGDREVFRVTLDDGGWTRTCAEHLWLTRTRSERRRKSDGAVRTTAQIRDTLARGGGGRNHSIPTGCEVLFAPGQALPVHPWLLGIILGDGCTVSGSIQISNPESDIRRRVRECLPPEDEISREDDLSLFVAGRDRRGSKTKSDLRTLEVDGLRSHEKFVPQSYLVAGRAERIALLQGLCDSDGFVTVPSGKSVEYVTTSPRLRDDIRFLVGSLGGLVSCRECMGRYRKDHEVVETRPYFRMVFSFPHGDLLPVSSEKHLSKWNYGSSRVTERFIDRVEPDGKAECVCIRVDASDHLYVTRDFILTHNSSLVLEFAKNAAIGAPRKEGWVNGAAVFSLEMPGEQLAMRYISLTSGVNMLRLRLATFTPRDYERMAQAGRELMPLEIYLDETPGISLDYLRTELRRKKAECERNKVDLRLAQLDFVQLMKMRDPDNLARSISEIAKGAKELAKELDMHVVLCSQLNRGVEARANKRPVMSDLKESGGIEENADNVFLLYRDEYYHENSRDQGIAEVIVAKQRNGPTGTLKVGFQKESARFHNIDNGDER